MIFKDSLPSDRREDEPARVGRTDDESHSARPEETTNRGTQLSTNLNISRPISKSQVSQRRVIGYEFGAFRMLPAERLLLQAGKPVSVTPKVFDTLLVFVRHSGHLLSKDELLRIIWDDSIVEPSNLSQNIFVLRKILGESPHEHRFLVTIPTRGYVFVAKVTEIFDEHPATGAPCEGGCDEPNMDTPLSLAVLPFTLLSHPESGDYFDEVGIADTLITKLSRLRRVLVRPTSAILKYAGAKQEALSAGRELCVDVVLAGTIQHMGERVRVNVQLIRIADGHVCWGAQFNEKFSDVFAVQDCIAEHIVEVLGVELGAGSERQAA
ncbi:MAG TPA: winged helix-turn-helix domain-containing protein [Pyrinomonadaceae bacterium]|nr:winged helix-turn-helix domain-containing protein [Pyrinomonadaceae bacterium]